MCPRENNFLLEVNFENVSQQTMKFEYLKNVSSTVLKIYNIPNINVTSTVSKMEECPPGFYSPGATITCYPCEAGFICSQGSTTANPEADLCPLGSWCDGKDQFRCPPGTYNPFNGSSSDADCLNCPAGEFYY